MSDNSNRSVQSVWQAQPVGGIKMSIEEVRGHAGSFERQVSHRNMREYLTAALVAVFFGYCMVRAHEILLRAAFAVWIAGLAYMAFQLHRKASANPLPWTLGAVPCVLFYRGELERQREALADVWSWYLSPLIPGFAVYTLGFLLHYPYWWSLAAMAVIDGVAAALFFGIWKLNERAAGSLQRRIDELDRSQQ